MSYDNLFRLIDSAFQETLSLHVHGPPGGGSISLTKNVSTVLHWVLLRLRLFEQRLTLPKLKLFCVRIIKQMSSNYICSLKTKSSNITLSLNRQNSDC